jgi:hypothetical protein
MVDVNARDLTIRNVPPQVMTALNTFRRRRGTSLNQTVIDLLRQSLGVGSPRKNGLSRHAGTWSEAEFREFEEATAVFETVDPELWR